MNELRNPEAVRSHFGEPSYMSKAKQMDHLDEHCKAFIQLSPFGRTVKAGALGNLDQILIVCGAVNFGLSRT